MALLADEGSTDHLASALALLLMAGLTIGLVFAASSRVALPFGPSHDGRNAGVWAGASRTLREEGPVASRFGTHTLVGGEESTYATHPPLIVIETGAAEAVLGERPWVSRLPAWGGTLAALLLSWLLLRACGLHPLASSIGVALAFGCPMIAVYGTMLDTPVVGFPFGIAVLLLWQRARSGRPAPVGLVAAVTALAVLSSWQGLLTAGFVTAAVVVPKVRRRSGAVPIAGYLIGTIGGGLLLTAWIAWAYGSLDPLIDQFFVRTGTGKESVGAGLIIGALQAYWPQVFTPWLLLLAIPALVAAARHPATRAVGCVAILVLGVWIIGLRDGAVHHDYWAYWIVLPLALGIGVMADSGLRLLTRWSHHPASVRIAFSGLVALAAGHGLIATGTTGAAPVSGARGGALLRETTYSPTQTTAWYVGDVIQPASWITYGARRPGVELARPVDLERLAAAAPADLVLVDVSRLRSDVRGPAAAPGCRFGIPPGRTFEMRTAAVLADEFSRHGIGCD